jgi:hypothetical protein
MSTSRISWCALGVVACLSIPARAQERAYFVTYDHYLEEAGALEISIASTTGMPRAGNAAYTAPWLEIEYGVTGWWTTETYLEGVAGGDGSAFTGWRWENRFRPLSGEHRVTPVLYFEYENVNEASRIQTAVVSRGALEFEPIAELRREHAHEVEARMILSSVIGAWNVAENLTLEKNLSEDEGLELGYSIGVSRSLGSLARGDRCRLCAENFVMGLEMYGGLGTSDSFGPDGARHYLAPVVSWRVGEGSTLKFSTGFGLTRASDRALVRVGLSYEFQTRGAR